MGWQVRQVLTRRCSWQWYSALAATHPLRSLLKRCHALVQGGFRAWYATPRGYRRASTRATSAAHLRLRLAAIGRSPSRVADFDALDPHDREIVPVIIQILREPGIFS